MAIAYPYPPGDGKVKWISTGWLGEHLDDERLTILDVQPNIHDYITEHIPGAVYMNEGLLRVSLRGRPGVYAPKESLQIVFSRVGLDPDVPVVVYTAPGPYSRCAAGMGDGLEQTMVSYSLARFGHDNVRVLDVGLQKWKAEGREVTRVFPDEEGSSFRVQVRDEYAVGYEEFKKIKDRDDVVLLDARPTKFYEGESPWSKPGHIPGAVNLPWRGLMDRDNPTLLRPEEEIRAAIEERNITPDKTIICSCGTGREATNEFILFKWRLGYPKVRLYESSYTEWTSYPENATVVGKNPH